MEFKEVIGRRRSIRFFDPDRPVEREKIQKMLEAARLASCAVNAHWARAVVGFRDDLTEDQLKRLKTPVAGLNVELAPVHIHWFNDLGVVQRNEGRPPEGTRRRRRAGADARLEPQVRRRFRLPADPQADDRGPALPDRLDVRCRHRRLPGAAHRRR